MNSRVNDNARIGACYNHLFSTKKQSQLTQQCRAALSKKSPLPTWCIFSRKNPGKLHGNGMLTVDKGIWRFGVEQKEMQSEEPDSEKFIEGLGMFQGAASGMEIRGRLLSQVWWGKGDLFRRRNLVLSFSMKLKVSSKTQGTRSAWVYSFAWDCQIKHRKSHSSN